MRWEQAKRYPVAWSRKPSGRLSSVHPMELDTRVGVVPAAQVGDCLEIAANVRHAAGKTIRLCGARET